MKGIAPLLIFAVIALLGFVAAVVAVPGLGQALASIADPARHCSETPFKSDCFCDASEDKLMAPALAGVIPRYFCEAKAKFLV